MKERCYTLNEQRTNEYRRHLDLGIYQWTPGDSHRDRICDADPLHPGAIRFHGKGLALSDRTSSGENSLASPVAQVRGAMGCSRSYRLR